MVDTVAENMRRITGDKKFVDNAVACEDKDREEQDTGRPAAAQGILLAFLTRRGLPGRFFSGEFWGRGGGRIRHGLWAPDGAKVPEVVDG